MELSKSLSELNDYLGQSVEIVAFGIAYRGLLKGVNWDLGTLTLVDGEDQVNIELERVEDFELLTPPT